MIQNLFFDEQIIKLFMKYVMNTNSRFWHSSILKQYLKDFISLQRDIDNLISFGNTDLGYLLRGEFAEMYCIPPEEIDYLIAFGMKQSDL
jgi:hypothetical protein